MRCLSAGLRCALLMGALATPALAGEITGLVPPEGNAGTPIQITGSGFGSGKPKVRLKDDATGHTFKLEVWAWSDTAITAVIKHGTPGPLTLLVKPKGSNVKLSAPFVLHAPEPVGVYPAIAGPGATIAILGDFVGGHAPLKVKIGGKKAKPTWLTVLGPSFIVPESLPYGVVDVVVSDAVGSATLPAALTIADPGPPLGQDRVTLHLEGGTHDFTGEHVVTFGVVGSGEALHVFTHDSGNATAGGLHLALWYEPHVTPLPAIYQDPPPTGSFGGGPLSVFQGSKTPYPTWDHASPWQITVETESGGQISGTFSGVCHHATKPDKAISGSYIITLPSPPILAATSPGGNAPPPVSATRARARAGAPPR